MLTSCACSSANSVYVGHIQPPPEGLNTLQPISRVTGALFILMILVDGWTLVLPLSPLCNKQSQWRRLSRQPGISACTMVATGMLISAAVACATPWIRDVVERHPGGSSSLLGSVPAVRWRYRVRSRLDGLCPDGRPVRECRAACRLAESGSGLTHDRPRPEMLTCFNIVLSQPLERWTGSCQYLFQVVRAILSSSTPGASNEVRLGEMHCLDLAVRHLLDFPPPRQLYAARTCSRSTESRLELGPESLFFDRGLLGPRGRCQRSRGRGVRIDRA